MSQAIQAQWNLDHTANSAISMARGVIQAATTDNVQPLAIVACERFGNTLAMSQETSLKIERTMVNPPESALVGLFNATISFRSGDCTTQLATSLAGVQFLALAAALLSTMETFEAAKTIQAMIVNTAKDKTLVPRVRQIEDLLESIKPRCSTSGFAREVIGWQTLLTGFPPYSEIIRNNRSICQPEFATSLTPCCPDSVGIQNLVDAFRQLNRIGREDISGIVIQTHMDGVAWTAAFAKWCLGTPPSITFKKGTSNLNQEDSPVHIIVLEGESASPKSFNVSIQSRINSLSDLIGARLDGPVIGLVPIPTAGAFLLQMQRLNNERGLRLIEEVIPFALRLVKDRLVFNRQLLARYGGPSVSSRNSSNPLEQLLSHPDPNRNAGNKRMFNWQGGPSLSENVEEDLEFQQRLSPFPDDDKISEMFSRLFCLKIKKRLKILGRGMLISDLPVLKLYLQEETEAHGQSTRHGCDVSGPGAICTGAKSSAMISLSKIVATILGLALFEHPDDLQVSINLESPRNLLQEDVRFILETGEYRFSDIRELLSYPRELILHSPNSSNFSFEEWASSILTCFRGQAAWPAIHQTQVIRRNGYLAMSWHPGSLIFNGEIYDMLWGNDNSIHKDVDLDEYGENLEVKEICNLRPSLQRPFWVTTISTRRVLLAAYSIDGAEIGYPSITFGVDVSRFHENLTESVILEGCCHSPNLQLGEPDRFAYFIHPITAADPTDVTDLENSGPRKVRVVPVDGDNSMRYMALKTYNTFKNPSTPIVFRQDACLRCCLDLCRKLGSNLLIL